MEFGTGVEFHQRQVPKHLQNLAHVRYLLSITIHIRLDIYRLSHTRQSARSSPGRAADAEEDGSVYIEACHTQQPLERERGDWRESRMEWNMDGRTDGGRESRQSGRASERAARVRDSGWHGSRHLCNGPRIVSRLVARLGSGRCDVSREST